MLIYKIGNLVNASENWIAHGCNARGVMGAGVAKAIRQAFPQAYDDYRHYHLRGGLTLGHNYLTSIFDDNRKRVIVNCITQQDYGNDPQKQYVSYEAVESCFNAMNTYAGEPAFCYNGELTLAMPKIGAGLGGGKWEILEEKAKRILVNFKQVAIYVLNESEIPESARKNNSQQSDQL